MSFKSESQSVNILKSNLANNLANKLKFMSSKQIVVLLFVFSLSVIHNNYTNIANSQKIRIVRTDVDKSRDTIITASYNFKFDIYLDSVQNCNSAALEFRYNNSNNIKLSSYKIGDFGENGKILIIPSADPVGATESTLKLRILSGNPIGENEFDSPNIVSLEFTVLQNAVHNSKLNIEFLQALVTSFKDSVAKEIILPLITQSYTIHSFINIYPGDANNDGIVNLSDWTKIDLFTALDPVSDKFRRFKRKNPSTMWTPQLVLAWDNELATYADCDGDGSITVSDAIVVVQNDAKTRTIKGNDGHSSGIALNDNNDLEIRNSNSIKNNSNNSNNSNNLLNMINENEIRIPIKINSDRKYKALQMQLDINHFLDINNYELEKNIDNNSIVGELEILDIEFQKNGAFSEFESDFIIDKRNIKLQNNNNVDIAVASFDPNFTSQNSEIIGFLIVKLNQKYMQLKANTNLDLFKQIYGVDYFGNKFDLILQNENITSVSDFDENINNDVELKQIANNIEITTAKNLNLINVELYNLTGEIVNKTDNSQSSSEISSNYISMNLDKINISGGLYFVKVEYSDTNNKVYQKLMKICK